MEAVGFPSNMTLVCIKKESPHMYMSVSQIEMLVRLNS